VVAERAAARASVRAVGEHPAATPTNVLRPDVALHPAWARMHQGSGEAARGLPPVGRARPAFFSLVVFALISAISPNVAVGAAVFGSDTFWHIAAGRLILQNWILPLG